MRLRGPPLIMLEEGLVTSLVRLAVVGRAMTTVECASTLYLQPETSQAKPSRATPTQGGVSYTLYCDSVKPLTFRLHS